MLFVGYDALAHRIEQVLYRIGMLLLNGHSRCYECHRRQLGNGDIRNHQEGGNQFAAILGHPLLDALRLHASGHHNKYLLVVVHHLTNTLQHLFHQPRLNNDTYHVGTLCCQLVAGRGGNAHIGKLVTGNTRRIADADILILDIIALDQALGHSATHGTSSNDTYLHSVCNIFFSLSMNSSASCLVRQSGGNSLSTFVPAQPVKQCSL